MSHPLLPLLRVGATSIDRRSLPTILEENQRRYFQHRMLSGNHPKIVKEATTQDVGEYLT
jgi:hypothetical protein